MKHYEFNATTRDANFKNYMDEKITVPEKDLTYEQGKILLKRLQRQYESYPDIVKLMFINQL